MGKYAQILDGRVHWVFTADTAPQFAPNIIIKDITSVNPQPQEGWYYDATTDTYSETAPTVPEDTTITTDDMVKYLYYKSTGVIAS